MGKEVDAGMKEALEQFVYIDVNSATIEKLEKYIGDITPLYNYALTVPDYGLVQRLDNAQKDAIKAYSKAQEHACYKTITEATEIEPMRMACMQMTYPILKIIDTQIEGCIPERAIVESEKKIDLLKLHAFSKRKLGVDTNWDYMAQAYNQTLTARAAKLIMSNEDLTTVLNEICDSMHMHRLAREIKNGVKDPTSNTQLLKALNELIGAMLGEEYKKCTSHDVQYMLMLYHKKGKKALSVQCSKHSAFAGILMDICHAKLMEKGYSVEFEKAKKR